MPPSRSGIRFERAHSGEVASRVIGILEFEKHHSGGKMNRHTERMSKGILGLLLGAVLGVLAMPVKAQSGGEALYKTKCAGCHGADGKGETSMGKANNIRDLGSADVQGQSDDVLAGIIGSGKGKMPAYGKSLKPEQIKDLVAYIRTLKK
jgi:mono/diheme cytochrome c family protein